MPKSKRVLTEFRKKYLSFAVSEQRRKVKLKSIEYKGGKCEHCGYNKCPAALAFHHLDPTQKDFGLSDTGVSRSFEKAKPELDKCILLCSNCHAELHHAEAMIARELREQEIRSEVKFSNQSIDWSNIDLIEMSKTKSLVEIAKEFGCNRNTIGNQIKKQRHTA